MSDRRVCVSYRRNDPGSFGLTIVMQPFADPSALGDAGTSGGKSTCTSENRASAERRVCPRKVGFVGIGSRITVLTTQSCQYYHLLRARHPSHRRSGSGERGFGGHAESPPLRAGHPRFSRDVGHAGRFGSAEGQLPPACAGGARAGYGWPMERKWGGLTERLLVATAAFLSSFRRAPWVRSPRIRVGKSTGCPRAISSPWAHGSRPRGGRSGSSCERGRQTPGDPGGGYRGSLPVGDGSGGFQQRTHRGHHDTRFEGTTTNPRPAAARIAWWSWRTLCRRSPSFQGAIDRA